MSVTWIARMKRFCPQKAMSPMQRSQPQSDLLGSARVPETADMARPGKVPKKPFHTVRTRGLMCCERGRRNLDLHSK